MMSKRTLPLVMAAVAIAACDTTDPVTPSLLPEASVSAMTSVPGVQEVVGETGPGSSYALFVPEGWNGELVVYAHGYEQPFMPVSFPDREFAGLRDWLLVNQFAVAYSTYSHTGYAVKDGAIRTHQLNGLFEESFGEPARTYLFGISMGGLVVDLLSERNGAQYDGTLAACGVMGGGQMSASYVATFRILFDHFFPGALPGSLYAMPDGYYVIPPNAAGYPGSDGFWAIRNAVLGNLGAAVELAGIDQIDLAYNDYNELVTSFLHVLGYQVNGANDLTAQLHGHGFFDNSGVAYTGSSDDDALNAGVARYTADPSAEQYFESWYEPTGDIRAPFITIHTTRDPLVPVLVEDVFAAKVAESGDGDLLLQRTVEAFGHCGFGAADLPTAFLSLVQWVRTGVKPAA